MKDETEIEKCNGRSKYFIANGEIDTNAEREVNNKGIIAYKLKIYGTLVRRQNEYKNSNR